MLLASLPDAAFGAYFKYKVINDIRYWDSVDAWYSDSDVPYGRVPTTGGDYVWLTGTELAPSTPLVVTNGVNAKPTSLVVGREAGSDAALCVKAGGSFAISGSGGADTRWGYVIGANGNGLLVNEGGAVDMYGGPRVGLNAGTCGIVSNLLGNTRIRTLYAGVAAGSTGIVVVAGGMVYDNSWAATGPIEFGVKGVGRLEVYAGGEYNGCSDGSKGQKHVYLGTDEGGDGTFLVKGGKVARAFVHIGHAAGATGRMKVSGPVTNDLMRTIFVGEDGTGTFDVESSFEVGELRIGGTGIGTGTMTVWGSATNSVREEYNHNSGNVYVGGGTNASYGAGLLSLKGGTICQTYRTTAFHIGNGMSPGTVRGWGLVLCSTTSSGFTRGLYFGNGCVIGDGEGIDRTLDFTSPNAFSRAVTNSVSGGTNGWYAINRGSVIYPFASYSKTNSDVSMTLGDNKADEPDLVNSVRVTISGSGKGAGVMHGGVYAGDRTDCHLDSLPANAGIVGVWKLGTAAEGPLWPSWEQGTPVEDWATASVKFRYDEAAIPDGSARLILYRYQDGAWAKVAEKRLAEANDGPVIETAALDRIAGDPANIGTFALTIRNPHGVRIIFR